MNQHLLDPVSHPYERVKRAIDALRNGQGVLVIDDDDRENEGDLIFAAESLTNEQMAILIRECSGIVCLVLTEEKIKALKIPMMAKNNHSRFKTAFTVSIEAARGVSTGVSAADRVTTIKAAISDNAKATDLHSPGHVFPLKACKGGVLERRGHTEATLDLMKLAGLKPYGVLCEVINVDGTMARSSELIDFSKKFNMPIVTIEELVNYRSSIEMKAS